MVIKGQEAVVRSRYEEDVYPGDHSSVWGSYWADGKWGYACCKSHLKNSLCMGNRVEEVAQQQRSRQTDAADQASKDKAGRTELNSDSVRNGEGDAGVESKARLFCFELRPALVLVQ
jgi:pre-mRNA-processing factor SLU7